MGKWGKVRWLLRALGVVAGSVAVAPVAAPIAIIAGIVGAAALGLSKDLPRDPWSKRERAQREVTPTDIPPPQYDDR